MHSVKVQIAATVILLSTISTNGEHQGFLPPENLSPCVCQLEEGHKVQVQCKHVNQTDLLKAISSLRGWSVHKFSIINSKLENIDRFIFQNLTMNYFSVINSTVLNFSLFGAFSETKERITRISFENVYIQHREFSPAIDFTNFDFFTFARCPITGRNESEVINYLPQNVDTIAYIFCALNSEETFSFVRFHRLRYLALDGNGLKHVSRSMLPQPALTLLLLSLSYNPIVSLPDDMFVNMPNLKHVWIHNTLLSTLPENVFKPVIGQMESFKIGGIPFNCDCEIRWLLRYKHLFTGSGSRDYPSPECFLPGYTQGTRIDNLTEEAICPLGPSP